MSVDDRVQETAIRLKRLVETVELSSTDRFVADQCLRRLGQPLRLTVFGTDPRHAISLINLMMGQPVVSPSIPRARVQFMYGKTAHARVQFRDGSQEKIDGGEFRRLFEGNPTRVRIYVDLPVLKKLSFLVAAESDPEQLCADVDKTLPAADIAIWAGAELTPQLGEVWENLPDRLRDHSYLALSPKMDFASWKGIAQEVVEIIRVDPRRAQDAKDAEGGVDKEEFRESGGAQIVKTIKREIDLLIQSALDAGEVLLLRYGDQLAEASEIADESSLADGQANNAFEEMEVQTPPQKRKKAYSVPLGKLASRSRLLQSATPGVRKPAPAPRTVSMAIKNMPKNMTRPVSKVSTKQ